MTSAHCEIVVSEQQGAISLTFSQFPVVLEEELTVELAFPTNTTPAEICVEGINMYMGKLPVIIEQRGRHYIKGVLFLGSCSEPNMRWQLMVKYTDELGQQRLARFMFNTDSNN